MKYNIETKFTNYLLIIFFLIFQICLHGMFHVRFLAPMNDQLLIFLNFILISLCIVVILNFTVAVYTIISLKIQGKYFIEINSEKKVLHLIDMDAISLPLLYFKNEKTFEFNLSKIEKVLLKKIGRKGTLLLVFVLENKKLRISNKVMNESDFFNLIEMLKSEQVLVQES